MTTKHWILLAEDDKDEVFLLRWAFRKAGLPHEILEVRDGVAAMDYLKGVPPFDDRSCYPLPRLLLMDLKMPRVNGFEVLAWLGTRPELRSLPAVVLSASAFHADIQNAMDLGAREFLTKPHDMEEFVRLVEGLQERWLGGEETIATAVASLAEGQARSSVELRT